MGILNELISGIFAKGQIGKGQQQTSAIHGNIKQVQMENISNVTIFLRRLVCWQII